MTGFAVTLVLTVIVFGLVARNRATAPHHTPVAPVQPQTGPAPVVKMDLAKEAVIDYNALSTDDRLSNLMEERKARYGVEKGVDLIVRSDETLTVGVSTVRMQEILDKAFLSRGKVVEEDLGQKGPLSEAGAREYGIYVVQPGDNIWNIHYALVKEYFAGSGTPLPPKADEPKRGGGSSGVGKLLKFSEKMVYIYNLADERIDVDIHLIQPLTKLVVYNMDEVFRLVEEIGMENLHRIQFDGETIWLPAS